MPATPTPVTSYPASDPGFAAVPVEDLLAGEADLIARIKLCYGIDRDGFERDVLTLVRRYAACVHLLPATADNYFSKPGGLLRLGLENEGTVRHCRDDPPIGIRPNILICSHHGSCKARSSCDLAFSASRYLLVGNSRLNARFIIERQASFLTFSKISKISKIGAYFSI